VLLTLPCARPLDDAWKVESEAAADEQAASRGAFSALTLASVLVKIARMIPAGVNPSMPAGSHIAADTDCIERRVQLLTQIAACEAASAPERLTVATPLKAFIAVTLCIVIFESAIPDVLVTAHTLLELLVRL
jgi:hypothetical protein